jgi:hypothetical protein
LSLRPSICKLSTTSTVIFAQFIDSTSFFVETAGKTLEELRGIFEAQNPRKASTKRAKVQMTESGQVLNVDDA